MTDLTDLTTPALILDLDRLERNCAVMLERAAQMGVRLRAHMKTAKSADVARMATRAAHRAITVSTVAEADYFAAAGFGDITYAVGIAAAKLPALAAIQASHCATINILVDSLEAVHAVATFSSRASAGFQVLIEIDCGGGRGGVTAGSDALLEIGRAIADAPALRLAGVLTHAGHSYGAHDIAGIRAIAEGERIAAVDAAERLRAAGHTIDVVSVGSTPTCTFADNLNGITEMRPGVYMLGDLDQVGLGVCGEDEIAATVLATVIGHNPRSLRMLIDAGALALSKDHAVDGGAHGYGLVLQINGQPVCPRMTVTDLHQEHGFVSSDDYEAMARACPIGSRVRIAPYHACLTAAPYDRYHLVRADDTVIVGMWPKVTGWSLAGAGSFQGATNDIR